MDEIKEKNNTEIIDVVDEFDYSTQSDSYNKNFIKWRKNKNNPYAYNFVLNKKESIYIDGKGFVNECAVETERKFLEKLLKLIGIAVILVVVIDNIFGKLLVNILEFAGIDIHNSFYNSVIYGGCTEVAAVMIIITVLKLVIPLIFVHSQIRMPLKLGMASELHAPGELILTICASLITGVIMGIPSAYSSETKEIFTFFKDYQADMSLWGQTEFVVYTFFDVIIVSILFELLFRGEMFNALRQFGDIYAIIVSSVIAGAVTLDLRSAPGMIAISAVASIGVLETGSIFTATTAHIVYKVYMLALTILEMNSSSDMFITRNMFMVATFCIAVVVFAIVLSITKKNNHRAIAKYTGQIPPLKRIPVTLKVFSFSAAVGMCILAMLLKVII